MGGYGIHWFRRDLRVLGNPALEWNLARNGGKVVGIFFVDSTFLSRPDFSPNRFAFLLNTLEALREELRALGGDLLVLDEIPKKGFSALLTQLKKSKKGKPSVVSFNRDYEPFARARDEGVSEMLVHGWGVEVHTERDHLVIEPHELKKESGEKSFYQVYSPFARKWFELLGRREIRGRVCPAEAKQTHFGLRWRDLLGVTDIYADRLEHFRAKNSKQVSVPIPKAGSKAALALLDEFDDELDDYSDQRDFPGVSGTSQLSMYLKNGSLTSAQVIARLGLENARFKAVPQKMGATQFLKQLVWREFYIHILWHCPWVENQAFLEKYRNIKWENREDLFEAWKEGRTGYPIVDAGMRQLRQTGWMHNRVRMIVASFLTKDLLIDWRWGERYFMEQLLDGDLAANNGGWQWAASTGCDPQPYFRIFNPTLQSRKFDRDGVYLKQWLPERAHLKGRALHEPIEPIVEHSSRRLKALAMYQPLAR